MLAVMDADAELGEAPQNDIRILSWRSIGNPAHAWMGSYCA